jgi:hypothetical protein
VGDEGLPWRSCPGGRRAAPSQQHGAEGEGIRRRSGGLIWIVAAWSASRKEREEEGGGWSVDGGAEGSWVRLALGFRCGAASMCTDGWDAVLLGGRSDGVFGGQSVGGKSLRSDWPDTMTLDQGFNK